MRGGPLSIPVSSLACFLGVPFPQDDQAAFHRLLLNFGLQFEPTDSPMGGYIGS